MSPHHKFSHKTKNLWAGVLFGLGFVAFIDETIFHQLLHWHKFYDRSTTSVGLISDGLFHAFSWFATVGALYLVADLMRRHAFWHKMFWGGKLLGGGGFQLYDGIIQHKLMRIHQIRYNVDILPYDLIWNITAAIMIIAGLLLIRSARKDSIRISGGRDLCIMSMHSFPLPSRCSLCFSQL